MNRVVASLPDSVEELCVVRLGLVIRQVWAIPYLARLARAIERSSAEATESGAGLLSTERFRSGWDHFLIFQYWSSFDALEAWSHRPPHSDWWREALERMRTREDFGVYHESYLVPRSGIESIYLNCPPVGLSKFGVRGEAVGRSTTSRDRLGRRGDGG